MRYDPIVRNNEFLRAYRRGKNYVHPMVVLYVFKRKKGPLRVGITSSKKVGNAVLRNRARRVIRHALYQTLPADAGPFDLVFVARGRTAHCKSPQVADALGVLLKKAGVTGGAAT